jgi:hypothetical protein
MVELELAFALLVARSSPNLSTATTTPRAKLKALAKWRVLLFPFEMSNSIWVVLLAK